ncbi:MAG: GlxA family transcriptional regulator [Rhizobiales bacterium]|nr:GlxA family transcriptional regulator [Hyphomicrobiales bacterium]
MRKAEAGGKADAALLRVGFLLARQFTLTAFAVFVDALRLASDEGDRSRQIKCRWTVMSARRAPVAASCGVEVMPTSGLVDPKGFDYLVVVGGLLHGGEQVDEATLAYIRKAAAAGVTLVGVCTGSFVLARAGALAGRKACVSWFHRRDFLETFADVTPVCDQLYLIEEDRITCSGGAGVADLAAALIERRVGAEAARKSLRVMLIDAPRPAAAPQPMPALPRSLLREGAARDEAVRRAVLLMEQHMARPQSIAEIARKVGLGARQLERRFLEETGETPAAVYRGMRLDYGRWLVAEAGRAVGEAAESAGFADSAHFTRAFRKRWGFAPSTARALRDVGNIPST